MRRLYDKIKYEMYPYLELLPEAEVENWPPANREDIIERAVERVKDYLNKVPVLTFRVSNVPVEVKLKVEYQKHESDDESLIFDYVLGRRKAVALGLPDILGFGRLVGVRILYTVPRKYYEEINKILKEELGEDGVEPDPSEIHEYAGIAKIPDITVYFVKPDFLTRKMKHQKSPRWIPLRSGFVRLVLEVIHADGKKDRIVLSEAEIYWIRHSGGCSGMAYIIKKKTGNAKLASKVYKICVENYGKIEDRNNFALLLIHRRKRVMKNGRPAWRDKRYYIVKNFINTGDLRLRPAVQFGNQEFRLVKGKELKFLLQSSELVMKKTGLWKVYSHLFTGWYRKVHAKSKRKSDLKMSTFTVYRVLNNDDLNDYYLILPDHGEDRIVVENLHHYEEGWGRILVVLRRGEGLLVKHKRV